MIVHTGFAIDNRYIRVKQGWPMEISQQLSLEHLRSIIQIGEAILTVRNIDELLSLINDETCCLLNAERSTLFIYDQKRNELYSRVASELEIHEIRICVGEGVVGHVAETRQLRHSPDAHADPWFNPQIDKETGFLTRNLVTIPLLNAADELVGVFQVLNKKNGGFSDVDLILLKVLSTQITIALENAVLFDALQNAHQDLMQLEVMKNKFINLSSHELLTPLTIIHGTVSVIQQLNICKTDEDPYDMLATLQEQVVRLTESIRRIINLSDLEYSHQQLESSAVHLQGLFEDIKKEVNSLTEARDLQVLMHFDDLKEGLKGDKIKLHQAVSNVILNAIRYTPDGGQITIDAESLVLKKYSDHDDFLKVSIKDTGIGIPKSEQKRIFRTFYEVKDILNHFSGTAEFNSGGLGLGLPITKRIIEAHQGWIELESEPDVGSIFTLFVPYNPP